jgi:hypothetical protein
LRNDSSVGKERYRVIADMIGPLSTLEILESKGEDDLYFLKYKMVSIVSEGVWTAAYGKHPLTGETWREMEKVIVPSNGLRALIVGKHRYLILTRRL